MILVQNHRQPLSGNNPQINLNSFMNRAITNFETYNKDYRRICLSGRQAAAVTNKKIICEQMKRAITNFDTQQND